MDANRIHRPFFSAAIVYTLTLGTAWGAYLLWQISEAGSFTAVSLHLINAHGHAQVFGWVGLFIMGFTLLTLPRFRHTALWRPRLAMSSLGLMTIGIAARLVGGYYWETAWGRAVGHIGSAAEIVAVTIFALIVVQVIRRSLSPLSNHDLYVLSSIFWLVGATVFSAVHFASTVTADSRETLLSQVATWQAPLRDIQIGGFMLVMILGVSQHILPNMYPHAITAPRKSTTVLILLNLAVVLAVVAHPVFIATKWTPALALRGLASVILLATVLWLVLPWRLWRPPGERDRSVKFISTAFAWLLASLLLTLLTPLYNSWSDMAFSHAYFGAARHAITVGFISQMIIGVAARVVPFLQQSVRNNLPSLWATFILINAGCLIRVTLQIATDHIPGAFQFIAVSGVLELTGIAIWGIHLIRLMFPRSPHQLHNDKDVFASNRTSNKPATM